jgi:hypothetical protein
VKGRKAAIRLTCSKGSTGCHGTLTLTGKVKVGRHTVTRKLGHVKFALNAGQTKTFKVKLSSLAVKRLKAAAHRRLKVNAKLARSDHGSTQTQKLTLALAKKR